MRRRRFIQALAAAGVTLPTLPGMTDVRDGRQGLGPARDLSPATRTNGIDASPGGAGPDAADARHLVLIELQGGNDGLNTVVPYANPLYRTLRPTLALARDAVVALDDGIGLHPALEPLMPLWTRGELAVVQGVGYPAPNRSHFRSIEIWETASDADETLVEGWLRPLARALPPRGAYGIKALALGRDEGPLAGAANDTVVFEDLAGFVRQARGLGERRAAEAGANAALAHLLAVERTTRDAALAFAERLDDAARAARPNAGERRRSPLERRLDLVARLIEADVGPQVFKVELGGFDTHAGQLGRHRGLLGQLGESLAAFAARLSTSGRWNDVLVMTYSEFGRRVAENGTGGTDHGTAAPHLVAGGRVAGGLHGRAPDLARLDRGDPAFTTDFRSLYASVARDWFGQPLESTPFAGFGRLPLVRGA